MAAVRRSGRRVIVLCEGETEEIALREFVRRQWNSEGLGLVGLETRNLHGHLTKAGLFAKGYLDDPTVLAVFTLIDLQGMTLVEHAPNDDVQTKVMRVQDWLHDEVQHPRSQDFHPHVAVHETEAWILAEGSALARRLRCTTIHPDPQAELKNFQRPPSERINDLFRQHRHGQAKRGYQKIEDGTPLFKALPFEPVYSSCPYFRAFYDGLKQVARA